MTALTIGISPCPNDIFIFSGMILDAIDVEDLAFEFRYEDVETLNRLAQGGDLDISKMSYANYPLVSDRYEHLEAGGALGYGCGPLLLTHGDALDMDRPVLIPGLFTTANLLLDFFLRRPIIKEAMPFDALYMRLLNEPGAQGVVIHEKRFTYEADGLTLVRDLGEYWETETGFPIPLGCIASLRSLQVGETVTRIVRRSLNWAWSNFDTAFALCREHAQDLTDTVVRAHIDLYVNSFSLDPGETGRAAVEFFFKEQSRIATGGTEAVTRP